MAHNDTPQQWVSTTLGEIVPYGKTQKCVLGDVTDETWVLELEDVEKESSKIVSRKEAKERPFKSTKNRFKEGDVLYGKLRPYLNKVVVADRDGVCSTEIIPLDAEPFVFNRYLFYWLKTRDFLNYVNDVSYGVNMPRLGTKDGVVAPFILAPLAEQKFIAEKLDTLLAQVESTKARLERIPKILKRFRQSVLAAAVSGKLIGGEAAVEKIIGDVAEVIGGITKNSKRASFPIKKPFLRVANVYENELRLGDVHEIGIKEKELSRAVVDYGDLLIVEGNGSVEHIGRVALWQGEIEGCVHQNHLIKVRADKNLLMPEFALYYLMSPLGKERIVEKATSGAGLYTLSISKISSVEIPIFTIKEQTEIVRRVDQLFAYADTIETQVNKALERVNNLTQSILAKAFRGELTEQWRQENPDLISGENSAEALLEKIKAERAAAKPVKRGRKTVKQG
ncbi:restriction endonuclease subunit S [Alcanivorax sp. IL3]|uniref:restriction endonuclease subunit S n=1 Tax=unclassified Alcanivorax TaxID=2638842 RepID=UPI0039C2C27C